VPDLETIGKYEITGKIGHGAMGEVFRAHDPVLNRDVAIKIIAGSLDSDETLRRRFEREAQSAARLSHPNIITIYDFGEHGGKLYMAMELLEGSDLKRSIAEHSLSLASRLDIMAQICEGLAFAHGHGIVHRDLKPANFHLLPNGKVKIMDFGLARLSGSDMTRTGLVMGTPHYMAPEQVRGTRADTRTDVFALGSVFYELLTWRKPFDAESVHAVMFKVMQEDPPPARHLAPDVPEVLLQVIDKALAKEPDERFQNADEMLQALQNARQAVVAGRREDRSVSLGRSQVVAPVRGPSSKMIRPAPTAAARPAPAVHRPDAAEVHAPRERRWLVWAAGAVGVLGLGLGAYVAVSSRRPRPAEAPSSEVAQLAQAVIGNQLELARRRLDASDYADALRQAERVLRIDAENAEAKAIADRARKALQQVDSAASAVRASVHSGDADKAADAIWNLMLLDPANAEAAQIPDRADAAFRGRIEEARRLMAEARSSADRAPGNRLPAFSEGARFVREAEKDERAGRSGAACRGYLLARQRFEQAAHQSR
jgi:tetratricopeptide (TPR) repeat protein